MSDQPRELPHLFVQGKANAEAFVPKGGGKKISPPPRDRRQHAEHLRQQIDAALAERRKLIEENPDVAESGGFYMAFRFSKGTGEEKAIESLENRQGSSPIELMVVKEEDNDVVATVFLPDARKDFYSKKVDGYRDNDTEGGKPKNEPLVSRIESVAYARVHSLFTDDNSQLPISDVRIWWEVWLTKNVLDRFRQRVGDQHLMVSEHSLKFNERDIVLVNASLEEMERLLDRSPRYIAELRLHRETPFTFIEMPLSDQRIYVEDFKSRIIQEETSDIFVCIVDSGVTQTHPLISDFLDLSNCYTQQLTGGGVDRRGHGTQLAGLALYGDLCVPLQAGQTVFVKHRLESSKILPDNRDVSVPEELRGYQTQNAVSLAEIANSTAQRITCLATTDNVDSTGRPTSWSAALDQLAFEDDETYRLVIVSAGNIRKSGHHRDDYLTLNDLEGIENPAQAWNALTVGAYTTKTLITDSTFQNYTALAPVGGLTPTSRTSVIWDRQWPIKPEIVLEGGNRACASDGSLDVAEDLSLLTTHHDPTRGLLDTVDATSAATALASRLAAQIQCEYPDLRPETVRGIIVHSAEWTPAMLSSVASSLKAEDKMLLLRRYGYGVPSLDRALKSARNDLTLVVEDDLVPFKQNSNGNSITSNEMNLHQFPWPKEVLEGLEEAKARMRVTLSYFIEANPGERGWGTRHSYQSHGLRFEVKHTTESLNNFRKRINQAAEEEDEMRASTGADKWFLRNFRGPGSVFSDWWEGDAVGLGTKDAIAVYPVGGWRKQRPYTNVWQRPVRYSLIVSISVPNSDVDIYLPISTALSIETPIAVPIETNR